MNIPSGAVESVHSEKRLVEEVTSRSIGHKAGGEINTSVFLSEWANSHFNSFTSAGRDREKPGVQVTGVFLVRLGIIVAYRRRLQNAEQLKQGLKKDPVNSIQMIK